MTFTLPRPRTNMFKKLKRAHTYLLLTEFEGRTASYGPSFFLLDLWSKREARRRAINRRGKNEDP